MISMINQSISLRFLKQIRRHEKNYHEFLKWVYIICNVTALKVVGLPGIFLGFAPPPPPGRELCLPWGKILGRHCLYRLNVFYHMSLLTDARCTRSEWRRSSLNQDCTRPTLPPHRLPWNGSTKPGTSVRPRRRRNMGRTFTDTVSDEDMRHYRFYS